jgi:LmbE family N-acetylglucosaminyl deacetylase
MPSKASANKTVAVIVAHPDDETLWAGGTILENPEWDCFVACLCRKNDADRSAKFYKILDLLNLEGVMGDLDDEPAQTPQATATVERAILQLLPKKHYDLILTHSPFGEYTRHRRHEEIGNAVIRLWESRRLSTEALWLFAYDDGGGKHLPEAIQQDASYERLLSSVWATKRKLMTMHYGFRHDSWEARTTPRAEAFWKFHQPSDAVYWHKLNQTKETK